MEGAPPASHVTIPENDTAFVTFEITCLTATLTPPVLFESDRSCDFEIYAMNPDGSGVIPLTENPGFDNEDPSWSWDNQKIIFRSNRSGTSDIWIMDADGSNSIQITDNEEDNEDPAISPDGMQIVYEEEIGDTGDLEIFIADANGDNPMQLMDSPGISEAPSFSPDGSTILFKNNRTGNFDVYVMDPAGQIETPLTDQLGDDFDPSWHPTEPTIIFSSQRFGVETLMLMEDDGENERQFVLPVEHYDWHPVFSTDGAQVIYPSDRDPLPGVVGPQDYELWMVNVDGTGNPVRLTTNGQRDDDAEYQKPAN